MKKLEYIDALRGMAVLSVLIVHCTAFDSSEYPSIIQSIVGNGGRGVQLFYVISAFTLFLSFSNRSSKENNVNSNFFLRRFFRIAPLFYIAITYFLAERYYLGNLRMDSVPPITFGSIISPFLFLHGFSPYWINNIVPGGWSVAVEMIFYCMVPFLFRKIKNMNGAVIFFFITICLQHVITLLIKQIPFSDALLMKDFLYYYLPSNLPVFACGIILYYFIYTPIQELRISPTLILLFALTWVFQLASGHNLYSFHILFGLSFIPLVYGLSKKNYNILVNPISKHLGKISYSMYLVHFAVLHWMTKLDLLYFDTPVILSFSMSNAIVRFMILLIMSVVISTITYHAIEIPFQNIGRKIISKRESKI